MSGKWMIAGNRTALYRSDIPAQGDGIASNMVCRAVLRELCAIGHDAGTVHVLSVELAARVGVTPRQVQRAVARMVADGWVQRPVRGVGNRMNIDPRASVYVLRPLPDADGRLWPDPEWVADRWSAYSQTGRFMYLSRANRAAVRMAVLTALTPVDNSESAAADISNNRTVLTQQPDSTVAPITIKQEERPVRPPHPRTVARARSNMKLIRPNKEDDPWSTGLPW